MSGGPESRARIAALSAAFKNRVADYLEVHGPATNAAMCEALGCDERYLRSKLSVMCAEGIAHSRRVPAPGRAPWMALYFYGPGEGGCNKEGTQRTVSKWKPQPIKHDPLHTAFFGAKQQQGE